MNTVPDQTSNPTTITAPPGTPFLDVVREFDAPVADVFRAHVDPDLVVQWLGPSRHEMTVERFDAQTGGGYAYVHRSEGVSAGFRGVFHTVDTDRTIIQTFEWDGLPDEVCLEKLTFTDLGGRTRLTGRSVFPSIEARDGAMASGMTDGMRESYDRLERVVGTLEA